MAEEITHLKQQSEVAEKPSFAEVHVHKHSVTFCKCIHCTSVCYVSVFFFHVPRTLKLISKKRRKMVSESVFVRFFGGVEHVLCVAMVT